MEREAAIDFEAFLAEWLTEVRAGSPSTVELGRRFAQKLFAQWQDVDASSSDIVYCDGAGDGGIDLAYLDRGEDDAPTECPCGERPARTLSNWLVTWITPSAG